MGKLPLTKFLWVKAVNATFIYLLVPFRVQNFKEILDWNQSYEDVLLLGPKNNPSAPNKNVLGKLINIIFIYLLTPFKWQLKKIPNLPLKKILTVKPEL